MKKITRKFIDLIIRYTFLILIALPNLWIFYSIFNPLTTYIVYFLLDIFFEPTTLTGNIITIGSCFPIELVEACIAGSAYYLLLILNLSIPNIKIQKRIKMVAFSFVFFFIINTLRIFFLSLIFISGSEWFDITHKLFWYVFSIFFVIGIWFAEVKVFQIKKIPFYSDINSLYKKSHLKK